MVTPCGPLGGGPPVALPGTLIIFPAVIARAPGAMGTLICWDVGAKLTVCNGAAGNTVIREVEAGIRIVPADTPACVDTIFWGFGGVIVTCL